MADTPGLNKTGIIYPNDYTLINLTLLTAVSTFDVKNILVELSYNEDIFNNTASGYLMLVDATGYIEKLHMNGNEFIRMTFGKADDATNIVDKIFRVFKVAKRIPENDGNTETYSLYFCSEELLLSEQYKVSKSYRSQDIASNVIDILKNYLQVPANKISVVEQTYGVYDFLVPNLKPFDAINWMSTYARPANNPGADMLLYEDKLGYNYRSLQSLFTQEVYNAYSFNPKNVSQKTQTNTQQIYNVLTYEIMDSYDSLGAINSGVYANQLLSVDPLLRRYKVTNFDYGAYSTKATKLNSFPITNNFTNRKGDGLNQTPQAVYKLVFSNYNQNDSSYIKSHSGSVAHDIFAETYIPYRTAQLPLLNYTRVKITVPGDPGLTVGRVVTFNLLSKDPNKKEPDDFYSGNYLITAVRHMMTVHQYRTVLELAKESNATQYSAVNTGSSVWNNTVKGIT
jgi:hypothetical protein